MRSRGNIFEVNKRGMYIVEASVVLPIFVLAMAMIISILPIIKTCENMMFSASDEMRLACASEGTVSASALPASLTGRLLNENKRISAIMIDSYIKGASDEGIDDLIKLKFTAKLRNDISLLPMGKMSFMGRLIGREFTGTTHRVTGEDDSTVYIFPESGKKYHIKGCRYLEAHCHMMYLNDAIKTRYHACPLCSAKSALVGTPIFLFESSGEAYHTKECRHVEKDKYYTGVTRSSARSSGYSACSVCGGGDE